MATQEKRNYLYLYDLPKKEVTSVKLAEAFKSAGVDIGVKKPQINRDLFKPFYSAVMHIEDPASYELAKDKMRYFNLDGCQVRALPFDKDLRGEAKAKIMTHNVFYKHPKDADKNQLTYTFLHEKFAKYGPIKSTKISLNPDYSNRGFAFVCFEDEEGTNKALADLEKTGTVFRFNTKDAREVARQLVNNLYFKNVPKEMKEEDIKKLFDPYGTIKSLVTLQNEMGQFGFVCYEDKSQKDKAYGADAVQKAISELQDKDMGNGQKLYIRQFLNKQQREQEKFQETIRYKNSKKRCNLYVKNFPANWTELELTNLFKTYGEIERVRLEKGYANNTYAFVCYKKPDACSMAKQQLHGQTYDGKGLVINHYEIKEIRDLQLEEMRDKRDWEKYINQFGAGLQWNQLTNQPNLSHIIQQLLQLIQQQPGGHQGDMRGRGGNQDRRMPNQNRGNFNKRPMPGQGGNNMMNQNMNPQQMMQGRGMPQPGMAQQPMMNPQMIQQQQMQQQQPQQNLTPQQKYLQQATGLINSVQERNPYMKEQVGHLIFDYVQMIVGQEKAPKITGMLIELPVQQIKQYMQSFEALQQRVQEANQLLMNPQQETQQE